MSRTTTAKPVRIQLSRKPGFILQEHSRSINGLPAKVCSRPSKFGNPIRLSGDCIYIDAGYRRKILDKWVFYNVGDIDIVLYLFYHIVEGKQFQDKDLQYWSDYFSQIDFNQLRNHNLACWCPLDKPCHVDVILGKLSDYNPLILTKA